MLMYVQWLPTLFTWYLGLLGIGLVFLPLTSWLFKNFKDYGYIFSKILGLACLSYFLLVINTARIVTFSQISIVGIILIALVLNWVIWLKKAWQLPKITILLGYEIFFLVMFLAYSYLKGFEPSVHSLEKYMDFGFIQSLLNTSYLPPQDMWFASTQAQNFSINYYYFGHFVSSLLIKLTNTLPSVGYNLMLATIFALATSASFSLGFNLYLFLTKATKKPNSTLLAVFAGLLAMAIMNFGANLQTLYLFTKGYIADNPAPFWQIWHSYNPQEYWYPNATRFIPFTIHEFPSYSYIVSDLHGHVLDIPFVLLILALSLVLIQSKNSRLTLLTLTFYSLVLAITYMTNSTDFLVYSTILFLVLLINYDRFWRVLKITGSTVLTALVLTLPFSLSFKPFASSLGLNCAPEFLTRLGSWGPFIFEADKCQNSPTWMLFVLWGFFWLVFLLFLQSIFFKLQEKTRPKIIYYFFFLFTASILLTMFAEFFYFKDIYPAHFRANTMFKLGYQAYIMMAIMSGVILIYVFKNKNILSLVFKIVWAIILLPMLVLILIYYQYAVPSYFGSLGFKTLDGSSWIKYQYPQSYKIIQLLNKLKINEEPFNIVEAHGDSYTDYNLVSAHTGIATIIGWPVHEWLWRGSYDLVQPRAAQVQLIYEGSTKDLPKIKKLLIEYKVKYIVIAEMEKQKYPNLNSQKFYKIAQPIYVDYQSNSYLFKINYD